VTTTSFNGKCVVLLLLEHFAFGLAIHEKTPLCLKREKKKKNDIKQNTTTTGNPRKQNITTFFL
jgi:hypothetical protein